MALMADFFSLSATSTYVTPNLLGELPLWFYSWLPVSVIALFLFLFGASVGSFL